MDATDQAWVTGALASSAKLRDVEAIARFATPAALAGLFEALQHDEPRARALMPLLEHVRVSFDATPLAALYDQGEPETQDAIARVLAAGHGEGIDPWLARELAEEELPPRRRGDLAGAVAKLRDQGFAEATLLELLDRHVALAVAGLARCGGAAARDALHERLKVPAWLGTQRRQVAQALKQIEARAGDAPALKQDAPGGLEPSL